ncbi:MinD/ParA family ATP-binding protein [Alpinimonas psychrophila]
MSNVPPKSTVKKPRATKAASATTAAAAATTAAQDLKDATDPVVSPQRVSDIENAPKIGTEDVTPAPEVGTIPSGHEQIIPGATRVIESSGVGAPTVSVVIDTGEIIIAEIEPEITPDLLTIEERAAYQAAFADEVPVTPSEIVTTTGTEGDVTLAGPSRRDMLKGEPFAHPEPVSMLTPERILEKSNKREVPSPGWNRFVYHATLHLVNLGDSPAERHRKAVDASISRPLTGGTRFVPVLTRKGGVGKTTVTTMIGMALARTREDRIIAIDANPDRGTLAERFTRTTEKTVRDLVAKTNAITSFSEFSTYVTRDKSRLDVLASDTDPFISEAFDENDYNVVADVVSRYYSVALTDCGTGIVHSVMTATLNRADSLVIVSGGSFDEARLAAETLTWLESNGYAELVRNSIVAINTATQGTNLVKISEIEAHFQSRVRDIVRIPYDPMLATGSVIDFDRLMPATQDAARTLAALVVDGLPSK